MIKDNDSVHDHVPPNEREMSEAEIDRNLQDTSPASDPPSWTLGTNHRQVPKVNDESEEDEPPPR
jgi:hypothetical protein